MTEAAEPIRILLESRNYRAAARYYVRCYRERSEPKDLANLATCCYKVGKFSWAHRLCLVSLDLSKGDSLDARLTLAHLALKEEKCREAISLYRQLLNTSHEIHGYLGIAAALKCSRKFRAARALLEQLVINLPDEYRSHLYLGIFELEYKNYRQAWIHFQKSLQLNQLCSESWEKAYWCAIGLERYEKALAIARKLVEFWPQSPEFFELLGNALINCDFPMEACQAYAVASEARPRSIALYLNSKIPSYRIPLVGSTSNRIASCILTVSKQIDRTIEKGFSWSLKGNQPLVNFLFFTAYSPLNLRKIFPPYLNMLRALAEPVLAAAIQQSQQMSEHWGQLVGSINGSPAPAKTQGTHRIRLGLLSRNFYAHSNTQAFQGLIRYLNRSIFEIILIHGPGTVPDPVQDRLNQEANEVVYLSSQLSHTHMLLSSLDLDILFFTDLGMDPFDFIIPSLRACSNQISGWGVPHTTGLDSIDFYLSSSLLEGPQHAAEYTENLVLLDGLPCCYLSESLHYEQRSKDYFLLPSDRLVIGCVQTLIKIHPDLDLIIEAIAKRLPNVLFAFVTYKDSHDLAFYNRLARRAPTAFKRTLLLERCVANDFLALCDCIDILLDTPYYGAGVTAYMSAYVGTPTVCFNGTRLRDSTVASIYRFLDIPSAPIVNTIPEYIEKVIDLAGSFELRFQIKRDTVAAAHRLYDNQEYVRSFEAFCCNLVGHSCS